jgi:Fur family ferric uptake transcriptional regulator
MMTEGASAAVLQELAERGYAATEPRRRIVACFLERQEAVTAADLYLRLRAKGESIGLVTVYRTLDLLVACRLAHVVMHEDPSQQERQFLPCGLAGHHHHLVCTACGRVQQVTDCHLAALEADLANSSGYRIDRHALTLFGCCPACLQEPRGDQPAHDTPRPDAAVARQRGPRGARIPG